MFSHPTASRLGNSKENELPENSFKAFPREGLLKPQYREKNNKMGHLSMLLYYNRKKI